MESRQKLDVWEALSTLSDAQELLARGQTKSANDVINHAKKHLGRVLDDEGDEKVHQIVGAQRLKGCTLGNPSNPRAKKGSYSGSFVVSFSKQELRTLEKTQGSMMPLVPIKLYFNSSGQLVVAEGPGL
ncbi:MAG: hypothetical protein Q8O76_05380, partial [Chloroflexota bacterium]|nr:hypothetical protein [Chloroflexota bacterium]